MPGLDAEPRGESELGVVGEAWGFRIAVRRRDGERRGKDQRVRECSRKKEMIRSLVPRG